MKTTLKPIEAKGKFKEFLQRNAVEIIEGLCDEVFCMLPAHRHALQLELFVFQHLIDSGRYKELSEYHIRFTILLAQMGDVTASQSMVDEGQVTLPITEKLYNKAEDELMELIEKGRKEVK